ncbi:MAG: nitrogenase [Candidatus Goldbacteria bacterium]|nr:nitrogenase [Candidatus Goldiibacteriota bacterium]
MKTKEAPAAVTNACKLCSPLGAVLAFKGIEGAVCILHGSQGCATYIRRYMISHYKEPLDVASSSFSEDTAIFGGSFTLMQGLDNLIKQYRPALIGVATTCLSETIGDDAGRILHDYKKERAGQGLPVLIKVSTAAYKGTHADGFVSAVRETVEALAKKGTKNDSVNIFPGMLSPEDLRNIKETAEVFGLRYTLFPDYSETLDAGQWGGYELLPPGGTPLEALTDTANAAVTIELGNSAGQGETAGKYLQKEFGVKRASLPVPIGVKATDLFMEELEKAAGKQIPDKYLKERGRLIDSYVDGHKYVFGVKAAVFGEEDLVVSMAAFLDEIGMIPSVCASGAPAGKLENLLREAIPDFDAKEITVLEDADFELIEQAVKKISPKIMIGSSKGYKISRKLNIPLVRCGFPVHDRAGGARIAHVLYKGSQQLFDRIVNKLLEDAQENSAAGFSYM